MLKPGNYGCTRETPDGKGNAEGNLITVCITSGVKVSGHITGLRYGTREVGTVL